MKSHSRAALGALGLALLVGTSVQCGYDPSPPNGQLGCSAKSECPEGYSCRTDNKCWKPGATGTAGSTGTAGKAGSGGAGGATLPLESFIGKWIFDDASTLTQACGSSMPKTGSLSGDYVDVAANAKPNTILGVYFCAWVLDVPPGGTAGIVEPNQTCMTTASDGSVYTWHGVTFTFSTTDGQNATLSSMLTATVVAKDSPAGTVPLACTVRIAGKLKLMQ